MIKIISGNSYKPLYEMANLPKTESGLPLDIWVDSARSKRNVPHNDIRIKIGEGSNLIPVSIYPTIKVLTHRKSFNPTDINTMLKFIRKNQELFIKHWNEEITDYQLLSLLINSAKSKNKRIKVRVKNNNNSDNKQNSQNNVKK